MHSPRSPRSCQPAWTASDDRTTAIKGDQQSEHADWKRDLERKPTHKLVYGSESRQSGLLRREGKAWSVDQLRPAQVRDLSTHPELLGQLGDPHYHLHDYSGSEIVTAKTSSMAVEPMKGARVHLLQADERSR